MYKRQAFAGQLRECFPNTVVAVLERRPLVHVIGAVSYTHLTRLQPNAQPGFWAECLGFFVSCGFNILQELFLRIIEQQALVMREIRIAPEVLDKPRGKPVRGQFGSEPVSYTHLDVYKRQPL